MDYFPHDTDASNDEKVEALRVLYGNDGYAFYFILLERIYRTNEAELDVSDAETIQILARKVAVTAEKFLQILETALKWKCFDRKDYEERGVLTSNGIKKRASVVVEKRVNMREKYQKKKEEVSDAETGEETTPETPQRKEKKRKEKKRKEKESKNDDSPTTITLSDAIKTFNQNIHPITPLEAEKLEAYLEDGFDETAITYAINKAVLSGARNMAYIEGILKRLRTAGILTMEAVEAAERDYQDKKAGKKTETVRGGNEYIPEKPPDAEQMAKNQEFMKGLFSSIGKTI